MGSHDVHNEQKQHVVCVPYPAQGHINPMMKVAKLLHTKGFHVTFVNTIYNHNRFLRSHGAKALDGLPSFRFEAIPDGMPETDVDVTQDIPALCESTVKSCLLPFKELLHGINARDDVPPVSCIVADGCMSFTLDAAEELGVPEVLFWTTSACGFMAYLHFYRFIEMGLSPFKGMMCTSAFVGSVNLCRCRVRTIGLLFLICGPSPTLTAAMSPTMCRESCYELSVVWFHRRRTSSSDMTWLGEDKFAVTGADLFIGNHRSTRLRPPTPTEQKYIVASSRPPSSSAVSWLSKTASSSVTLFSRIRFTLPTHMTQLLGPSKHYKGPNPKKLFSFSSLAIRIVLRLQPLSTFDCLTSQLSFADFFSVKELPSSTGGWLPLQSSLTSFGFSLEIFSVAARSLPQPPSVMSSPTLTSLHQRKLFDTHPCSNPIALLCLWVLTVKSLMFRPFNMLCDSARAIHQHQCVKIVRFDVVIPLIFDAVAKVTNRVSLHIVNNHLLFFNFSPIDFVCVKKSNQISSSRGKDRSTFHSSFFLDRATPPLFLSQGSPIDSSFGKSYQISSCRGQERSLPQSSSIEERHLPPSLTSHIKLINVTNVSSFEGSNLSFKSFLDVMNRVDFLYDVLSNFLSLYLYLLITLNVLLVWYIVACSMFPKL